MQQQPGWYYAKGDPPRTVRYWDGELWIGEPVLSPNAPEYRPIQTGRSRDQRFGDVGERLGARLIDYALLFVPLLALRGALSDLNDFGSSVGERFLFLGVVAAFAFVYDVVMVVLRGATIGKSLVGLKIVTEDLQSKPGWVAASVRAAPTLLWGVPALGMFIRLAVAATNGVMIGNDANNRSMYDQIAKTWVIRTSSRT